MPSLRPGTPKKLRMPAWMRSICEGFEAGGHKGFLTELTTFVVTPMVADAVDIPVITGGGIGDARGVLAALALGADAI